MPRRGLPWAVQIRLLAALLLVAASCESSGSAGLRSRFTLAFSPGALPGKGPDRRRDAAAAGGIMASGSRGRRLSMRQPALTRGLLHPGFPRIGGMPEAAGGAVPLWLPGREGPFACRGSAQGTQGAGVGKQKNQGLRELSVDTLHDRLEALLDEQWQRASVDYGYKPQGAAPGAPAGANVTWGKVKHVVGGFSVVVRMPEEGLAYRMQPMRSLKAGLTWVAFYMMLQEAALDRRAGAEASSADVLFRPDRSVMLGKSASSVRASGGGRRLGWEHMEVAREFQGPRLRHATKRLVYFRHQLLKTSSAAYQQGRCTSADNCPISPTDGGALEGPCMTNGLMFPSHWFWIKVGNPADIPGVRADSTEDHDPDAAQSHEVGEPPKPTGAKRMKGAELASALLLRSKKTSPPPRPTRAAEGPRANATAAAPGLGAAPAAVNLEPVKVLASVFPHAQGDVGGLCKRLWMAGAADNVTVLVLQSVLRGLRRLHSIGIPHGDLKAANVLYVDGMFCLTDMPALNWSATPVLTKDPVAHTLVQGKRFLANDMWGLGIITLSLVAGYSEMEAVKASLRRLEPRAYNAAPPASRKMDAATQNWLVVVLMLLHFLGRAGSPMAMDSANAAMKALSSNWLRRHVPAVSSKAYLEACQKAARSLAAAVLIPGRSPAVIESLAYCLDITDLARNAHGIPWPTDAGGGDPDPDVPDDASPAEESR